jgi:hypothetical protein
MIFVLKISAANVNQVRSYINRKSVETGKLTVEMVLGWSARKSTLPVL